DLPRASREHEHRRLLAPALHLELAPPHAHLQSGAQSLEPRLLGGESRGEMGRRVAPGPAIGNLGVGEHPFDEAVLPAIDRGAHSRNAHEIDAETADPHRSPICVRMSPASSSAIAWMRAPSAPSIITLASDSVPEYLIRTRPRPPISCSNAACRSATPSTASIGGLARTGTLMSTWGNFVRQDASDARVSPVSTATLSSARAERMPSPVGAWSRKRRWPDCSPPRFAPSRCISSET